MEYIFLPWVQHKMYPLATGQPDASGRPSLSVQVDLAVSGGDALTVTLNEFQLMGAGDVAGVEAAAVIRTVPKEGEQQYDPKLLAALEFYEEDFPWRYSPLRGAPPSGNQDQRWPWCTLLVLEEGEFELLDQGTAPLPIIRVNNAAAAVFPEFGTLWAWAHVQALQSVVNTEVFLNDDLTQDPDLAYSRLFSPRRLKPNTGYTGFLIPSFEAGRQAGLGLVPNSATPLGPAWADPSQPFPVYYRWAFRTGPAGDFESLARLLHPTARIRNVGPAVTFPLAGTSSYGFTLPTALQDLGKPPSAIDRPVVSRLSGALAQPVSTAGAPGYKRPLLTAPVYGRTYHRTGAHLTKEDDIPDATLLNPVGSPPMDWKDRVNLDISYRAIAALGSQYVQDNQEAYMTQAWEQVQDVLLANENLRNMQRALQTSSSLRAQHLPVTGGGAAFRLAGTGAAQSGGELANYGLHLAGLALRRLKVPSTGLSAYETIRRSECPLAVFSPAFRRLAKPFGRYQTAMAGRPLRPDEPEVVNNLETLLEEGTSLQQRDSLLALVVSGAVTGADTKAAMFNMYQFDDALVDELLEELHAGEVPLHYFDGNIEQVIHGSQAWTVALTSFQGVQFTPPKTVKPKLNLIEIKEAIIAGTDPAPVLLSRATRALRLEAHYPDDPVSLTGPTGNHSLAARGPALSALAQLLSLNEIMAYPVFKEAMGEPLQRAHPELFLPGLAAFPNNTIAVFEINQAFTEAYLLGLNHAMGSELLWRGFPTDLKGSYFRQFWNSYEYIALTVDPTLPGEQAKLEERHRDVKPLHLWSAGLGDNKNLNSPSVLLLTIRADVLRRFPNTVICARKAVTGTIQGREGLVPDSNPATVSLFPSRRIDTGSDIIMLSFELSLAEARGNEGAPDNMGVPDWGYFFLLMERPGQLQFGLDTALNNSGDESSRLESWDSLSWPVMGVAEGGNLVITTAAPRIDTLVPLTTEPVRGFDNGAHAAYALVQKPFLVAVHADEFI